MADKKKQPSPKDVWRLILMVIAVVAIVQELRKPAAERTWHGKVADLVPYDFRTPTKERIRNTYWNPEGLSNCALSAWNWLWIAGGGLFWLVVLLGVYGILFMDL